MATPAELQDDARNAPQRGGPPRRRLLIVDDEQPQLRALCETLTLEGYETEGFGSARQALAQLRPGRHELLLTDLQMPEMDGIGLIAAARQIDPALDAIVMTGHGTIDTAVKAMQGGAIDYILKPFRLNVILSVVERALHVQRLRREHTALQAHERRQAEELAAAYADLESFTYSISHDLRGPLSFVRGFADRLHTRFAGQLGEEGLGLVQVIRDGSRSMEEMITGLLEFSRASRQPLERQRLWMDHVVQSALESALKAHAGPQPRIETQPLPDAAGDPTVIGHVWSNLIGNALKFSARREEPWIRIDGRVADGQSIYRIQDNGVGFEMQQAERLFGVFRRLHGEVEFPGTGVGLAIAHRIIARHGGWIRARGVPDAGACFEFALPTWNDV